MIKAPISLQDLRRSLYIKAKAELAWRFWGLYVHVCKTETLYEAYQMAKRNDGAPEIDGVTFEAIEESGVEGFLKQIQGELVTNTYRPMPARKKEIAKDGGNKIRVLSIPAIRDRVVQGGEAHPGADLRSRLPKSTDLENWSGREDVELASFAEDSWFRLSQMRGRLTTFIRRCLSVSFGAVLFSKSASAKTESASSFPPFD